MKKESVLSGDAFRRPDVCATPDVLTALRAATAAQHQIIDRSLPLACPNPTRADYLEHLQLIRVWLAPLEAWLGTSRDTALVDSDLADAGLSSARMFAYARTIYWPAEAAAPYRWGARYVVEGSRLGAADMHRRLRHTLLTDHLRYLRGDETRSSRRWPDFLRDLRAMVCSPADILEACRGAADAFEALLQIDRQRRANSRTCPESA